MSSKKRRKKGAVAGDAWERARKLCRLNPRQLEMAKKLGMNPGKLPGLRPSSTQRWKLPVGEFIEECYWKRFGRGAERSGVERDAQRPVPAPPRPSLDDAAIRASHQIAALRVYVANLSDDLDRWLAHGVIAPELPARLGEELRAVADRLDRREALPPWPDIEPPAGAEIEEDGAPGGVDSPDDIPF